MTKRNLVHILDAPHYKVYIPFLRKLKDYKCTLWSKKHDTPMLPVKLLTFIIVQYFYTNFNVFFDNVIASIQNL